MENEKYQWAIMLKKLSQDELKGVIKSYETILAFNLDENNKSRTSGYLKFAKTLLKGVNE